MRGVKNLLPLSGENFRPSLFYLPPPAGLHALR